MTQHQTPAETADEIYERAHDFRCAAVGGVANAADALVAAIDRLAAVASANAEDAERYRWLRGEPNLLVVQRIVNDTPEGMDAAIDAARKEPQ